MRAMRILAALGLLLVASTAAAQAGTPPTTPPQGAPQQGGDRMQQMNDMMFKDITLTPEQKTKIDSIQTKQREEQRTLMQAGGGMRDSASLAKMTELRSRSNAAIRAVLTAEQQVIFDKNLAAMPAGGRRPPRQR
jgi:Spy/CpxP family protein refolding chaperone